MMWLPKALVDPKLKRKYRAEKRAATRVRTRWSSRGLISLKICQVEYKLLLPRRDDVGFQMDVMNYLDP